MPNYLKENLSAIRIFLSLLNLTLSDTQNIETQFGYDIAILSSFSIYDEENKRVGTLTFDDSHIYIKANLSPSINLQAMVDLAYPVFEDNDVTSFTNAIYYKILADADKEIKGHIIFYIYLNSQGEKSVKCSISVERFKEGISEFTLKAGFSKILSLSLGQRKVVDIDLYTLNKDGTYKRTKAPSVPNYKMVYKIDDETNKTYIARESCPLKTDSKEEILRDKKTLENYQHIDSVRRKLTFQDIPFFDRLMVITLSELSAEEFSSFLGFERPNLSYQNGYQDLTDAYFKTKCKKK